MIVDVVVDFHVVVDLNLNSNTTFDVVLNGAASRLVQGGVHVQVHVEDKVKLKVKVKGAI